VSAPLPNDEFNAFSFRSEEAKRLAFADQPKELFALTFGNFTALRLRSRRALSSAHCAATITAILRATQSKLENKNLNT